MLYRLTEFLPASILVIMAKVTGKSRLTAIERRVQGEFIAGLLLDRESGQKTSQPKIVAMVGSIGSGKSSVAQALAKELPAVVVEGDAIRVLLRKAGVGYDRVWEIGRQAAMAAVKSGKYVVIDGDASPAEQRKILIETAKRANAEVIFVRAVCRDLDVLIERIFTTPYPEDSFFGGAGTTAKGSADQRGAVVKMREFISLLRRHYRPEKTKYPGRDNWMPKKMSFVGYEVDTTDEKAWPIEVKRISKQIKLR